MIATLVWVLILLLVCGLLCYAVRLLPVEQPFQNIVVIVLIIIFALVILQLVVGVVPWPAGRLR